MGCALRALGLGLLLTVACFAQATAPMWRLGPDGRIQSDGGRGLTTTSVRWNPQALIKPACGPAVRGTLWVSYSGSGTMDSMEVCAKNAADVYAWTAVGSGGGGVTANTIRNGLTVPANSLGNDGDFYIRLFSVDACLYGPKVSGVWPATPLTLTGPDCGSGGGGTPTLMTWNSVGMTWNSVPATWN